MEKKSDDDDVAPQNQNYFEARNMPPPGTIKCNTHTTKRINQILGLSPGQAIDMAYTYLRQEKTTGH
jgi:hypothetical protein